MSGAPGTEMVAVHGQTITNHSRRDDPLSARRCDEPIGRADG